MGQVTVRQVVGGAMQPLVTRTRTRMERYDTRTHVHTTPHHKTITKQRTTTLPRCHTAPCPTTNRFPLPTSYFPLNTQHSFTLSLTPSLPHSLTPSLLHALTHSLTPSPQSSPLPSASPPHSLWLPFLGGGCDISIRWVVGGRW